MDQLEQAISLDYGAIALGMTQDREYVITEAVYRHFLGAFDDRSPLHVDAGYAKAQGFEAPVMHGSILSGFVSHFVGMVLPGARSMLLSLELRFLHPSFLGDRLRLQAEVAQKLDSQQVVLLHLKFQNETRGYAAATGRVSVRVRSS